MKSFLAMAALLAITASGIMPAAAADDSHSTRTGTHHNWIWVRVTDSQDGATGQTPTTDAAHPAGSFHVTNVCALTGSAVCHEYAQCQDGSREQQSFYVDVNGGISDLVHWCTSSGVEQPQPSLTPARILDAFRRLPLPESPLLIQPSGGETIVNFDTIFYTTQEPFTRTVRLLGHEVTFSIEPTRFTWVWGDGEQETTTTPGQPYRRGVSVSHNLTHRYLTADRFRPRLDTTYTATYSADGRAARPVNGTVTITGTPQDLRTVEYTPVLVDG